MKKIESGSLAVMLDEETLGLRIEKDGVVWNTDPKKTPELIFAEGTYRFLDAEEISHEVYSFGVGCGIRTGKHQPLVFLHNFQLPAKFVTHIPMTTIPH